MKLSCFFFGPSRVYAEAATFLGLDQYGLTIDDISSRKNLASACKVFKDADLDESGGLDLDEMAKLFSLPGNPFLLRLFSLDMDGNDSVDFPEFLAGMALLDECSTRQRLAFRLMDRDGDGTISRNDVLAMCKVEKDARRKKLDETSGLLLRRKADGEARSTVIKEVNRKYRCLADAAEQFPISREQFEEDDFCERFPQIFSACHQLYKVMWRYAAPAASVAAELRARGVLLPSPGGSRRGRRARAPPAKRRLSSNGGLSHHHPPGRSQLRPPTPNKSPGPTAVSSPGRPPSPDDVSTFGAGDGSPGPAYEVPLPVDMYKSAPETNPPPPLEPAAGEIEMGREGGASPRRAPPAAAAAPGGRRLRRSHAVETVRAAEGEEDLPVERGANDASPAKAAVVAPAAAGLGGRMLLRSNAVAVERGSAEEIEPLGPAKVQLPKLVASCDVRPAPAPSVPVGKAGGESASFGGGVRGSFKGLRGSLRRSQALVRTGVMEGAEPMNPGVWKSGWLEPPQKGGRLSRRRGGGGGGGGPAAAPPAGDCRGGVRDSASSPRGRGPPSSAAGGGESGGDSRSSSSSPTSGRKGGGVGAQGASGCYDAAAAVAVKGPSRTRDEWALERTLERRSRSRSGGSLNGRPSSDDSLKSSSLGSSGRYSGLRNGRPDRGEDASLKELAGGGGGGRQLAPIRTLPASSPSEEARAQAPAPSGASPVQGGEVARPASPARGLSSTLLAKRATDRYGGGGAGVGAAGMTWEGANSSPKQLLPPIEGHGAGRQENAGVRRWRAAVAKVAGANRVAAAVKAHRGQGVAVRKGGGRGGAAARLRSLPVAQVS